MLTKITLDVKGQSEAAVYVAKRLNIKN